MANHQYKLLMIDIDGTLVNSGGDISAEDREALDKVRHSGIPVCLSTGRALRACSNIIDRLSLDSYHISFDGALISSLTSGEEISVQPIGKEMVRQMVEYVHLNDIDLDLYSTTQYFAERETWSTEAHRWFFDLPPTIADFTTLWEQERIVKGGMTSTTPQEMDRAKSFYHHFRDSLHFSRARTPAYPATTFTNILAPQVSKGSALEALVGHLGLSLAEVIAVGDGINDISLLSSAGLAIAMGNASGEVKAVADYITLDVEQSGLAAAIKKFLL